MLFKEKIISVGKYFFLAGVALLIVRNNSYPFFIKRASDILFFVSALIAFFVIVRFRTGYEKFLARKNILIALSLIVLGIVVASLNGYFSEGLVFTKEGLLNIGRFAEVFAILFLVSFFQSFDENFYKKAALAQLSTLVYLPMLFLQNTKLGIAMYRFQLFENWPSNVGYYLIVSLTCISVFALERTNPFKKSFLVFFATGIGLSAIMLWAQSRASWLGLALSFSMFIFFWAEKNIKKIAFAFLSLILIFAAAFLILTSETKTLILSRISPSFAGMFSQTENTRASAAAQQGLLGDQHRFDLWGIYSKKLLESRSGSGVNYKPVNTGSGPQGPHNTILEFLVLAGPIGLAGFIYAFAVAFSNLFEKIRVADYEMKLWLAYVLSSLAGLVVASMFDNMSLFRLMWLLVGIGIFV